MQTIGDILQELLTVTGDRAEHPVVGSYTNYLLDKGEDKILKKFGEEAIELIVTAKKHDAELTVGEIADVLYHLTVLLYDQKLSWNQVAKELCSRREERFDS